MDTREQTRKRIDSLPDNVWDCERCGATDSMQLRRSSLNEQFYADDTGLKCAECRYYATHGIPFESPDQFAKERAERDSRVIDFTEENGDKVAERLEALGYVGKANEV